jgi:DNA-binding winged helix-turn-helix (wHTH) protein/tetratricopeptide (TPR) repeat protein
MNDVPRDGPDDADPPGRIVLARQTPIMLGPLLIEPAMRSLVHEDGRREIVEQRVMQVLVALLRADGAILTRDDLIASCWDGRIVGDDAINRVMSRLRRLADGIGAGVFRIETITKVGYRLSVAGEPTGPPKPSMSAGIGRRAARSRLRWLSSVGLVVLLVAAGLWWMLRPAPTSNLAMRLGEIESVGPGVPPVAAEIVNAELGTAFADDPGIVIVPNGGDFVLRGTIRRVGAMLRYTIRLETADGALLWSESSDQSLADPLAPRQVAIRAIFRIGCGLSAATTYGRRLPSRTLSLYLTQCQVAQSDSAGRALDVARRIVRETPDFSMGWSALANAASDLIGQGDPARDSQLRREAEAAVERALRLDPRNGQAWSVRAYLTPATRPLDREAMMRRSVEVRPSDCGCEHQYYGQFLMSVGRTRDALPMLQRAVDMVPQGPTTNLRLAMAYYQSGQGQRGDELMRNLVAVWRGIPSLARAEAIAAVFAGRWADAARFVEAETPEKSATLREAFAALAAGDPARIATASAAVEALARGPANDPVVMQALAAMGRREAALASADRLISPGEADGAPFLFFPTMRPLWREPTFERLLGKAGLLDYWRASRTRPDMCREADPPRFCHTL